MAAYSEREMRPITSLRHGPITRGGSCVRDFSCSDPTRFASLTHQNQTTGLLAPPHAAFLPDPNPPRRLPFPSSSSTPTAAAPPDSGEPSRACARTETSRTGDMNPYDLRYADPSSYRDRRSDLAGAPVLAASAPAAANPYAAAYAPAPAAPVAPAGGDFSRFGGRGRGGGAGGGGWGRGGGGGAGGYRGGGGRGGGRDALDSLSLPKPDFRSLIPFEKNFYVECPAVQAMSDMDVSQYRRQRDITVEGHDVPKPVRYFQEANFPEYCMQAIAKSGFVEPTPIQSQGWPMALKGRDMIGIAQTGSGKTLSYLLPGLVHVGAQPRLENWLFKYNKNLANLDHTQEPEALVSMVEHLRDHKYVTLEEIRPDRQTLYWSATWPREVESLARQFLQNPYKVIIGSPDLKANHSIQQIIEVISEHEKYPRLSKLLSDLMDGSRILIFFQTKKDCDKVTRQLRMDGWPALSIHGDKAQAERDYVLAEFKSGKSPIMAATDVAARGLDYIHRIGRTGRAGASGTAFTFFTHSNAKFSRNLVKILREAGQVVNPALESMAKSASSMGGGNFRSRGRGGFGNRSGSNSIPIRGRRPY
uniref:RNA helicase n=1 Tax=Oryza meridionalis TaxID=40149 RepID=A0A0E0CBZ5_9ORYZ